MSWQAMGAVQEASRFVGGREFLGYRVLSAIAWYADEKGVAGRAGQRTACPTHKAIAGRARVHVNTVRNWLPRLEAAGELAIERHGAGRSVHTVYRILLPMAEPGAGGRVVAQEQEPAAPADGQTVAALAQQLARLEEEVREMKRELEDGGQRAAGVDRASERAHGAAERSQVGPQEGAERSQVGPQEGAERPQVEPQENAVRPQENAKRPQLRPQETGQKATRVQREHVADPLDPIFDPIIDPEGDPGGYRAIEKYKQEKGHKAPPSPPPHSNGEKNSFQKRVEALATVCGLDLRIVAHRRQCEQAARQLAPYEAALILERFAPLSSSAGQRPAAWHWYVDDWRGARKGEQPRPKDVVANISRRRVPVAPQEPLHSANGNSPGTEENLGPAEIAFRELMKQEEARNAAIHARWLG